MKKVTGLNIHITEMHRKYREETRDCEKRHATFASANAITNSNHCRGNTRGTCPFRNLPEPRGNLVSHKRVRKQKPARDITTVAPQKRGVPTGEEHVTFVAAAYRNPISYHIGECVNEDDGT